MRVELGLYQHYKGGKYEVFGTGLNETDQVPVVIYKSVAEAGNLDKFWVRPIQSFLEMVETEQGVVPRFSKLQQ